MLRGDGRDDGEVADLKVTGPVRHGQGENGVAGRDLLRDLPKFGGRRGMRAVGQRRDATAMVMITDSAHEYGDAPCGGIRHRGADFVYRHRPGPQFGHPDYSHDAKLPRRRCDQSDQDTRRRLRTWRTIAAVPMTATVAPAAVMVASFLSSRRPATAWWPAR